MEFFPITLNGDKSSLSRQGRQHLKKIKNQATAYKKEENTGFK